MYTSTHMQHTLIRATSASYIGDNYKLPIYVKHACMCRNSGRMVSDEASIFICLCNGTSHTAHMNLTTRSVNDIVHSSGYPGDRQGIPCMILLFRRCSCHGIGACLHGNTYVCALRGVAAVVHGGGSATTDAVQDCLRRGYTLQFIAISSKNI